MARGRTVSLKGADAEAFMNMKRGIAPKNDDAKYERVLTMLTLHIKEGTAAGRGRALDLLKLTVVEGIDAAVAVVTG